MHQLSDDISATFLEGFVHFYLYMFNVYNNSLAWVLPWARHRARCIAHATSLTPLRGVGTTWSQIME